MFLSFCLIFCQFHSGVAYKIVSHKKAWISTRKLQRIFTDVAKLQLQRCFQQLTIFTEKLHLRCLAGFWIHQSVSYANKTSISRYSRPEVFYKIGVIETVAKFTGKHLCQSLIFSKVGGDPLDFAKVWRTPFSTEQLKFLFAVRFVNVLQYDYNLLFYLY